MRLCWAPFVVLCAACYQPAASAGAPCGPSGECPSGLECQAGMCLPPGSLIDDAAGPSDTADALPVDAAAIAADAAPDAPVALSPWGTPMQLGLSIGGETDPSMTQNRLTLVFMSENDDDLYIATRATPTGALTATELTVLSSSSVDKSPEISPDGSTIYFTSNRDGDYDVYRSTFTTVWSAPVRLPDLSSAEDESDVAVSPDGLTAVVIENQATNRFLVHTRATTAQAFGIGVHRPELSVTDDASAPTITNGGAVIYFHGGGTRDIYMATRKSDGTYTTPVLVTELNTANRDAAPFVLQDNKHMVFERSSDLYEVARP